MEREREWKWLWLGRILICIPISLYVLLVCVLIIAPKFKITYSDHSWFAGILEHSNFFWEGIESFKTTSLKKQNWGNKYLWRQILLRSFVNKPSSQVINTNIQFLHTLWSYYYSISCNITSWCFLDFDLWKKQLMYV